MNRFAQWLIRCFGLCCIFFFKQKTAYEMRISDWSSDVCSSDLAALIELGVDSLLHVTVLLFVIRLSAISSKSTLLPIYIFRTVRRIAVNGNSFVSFSKTEVDRTASCSRCGPARSLRAPPCCCRADRSAERRVGKECGSTCSTRGSPYH